MIKELIKRSNLYKAYRKYQEKKWQARMNVVNEAFRKEALYVLQRYSDALLSEGIEFWLAFGTLLGYYREHDFIKHDYDLDTGAWYKDHERIRKALEKNGFERVRYYYIKNHEGLEECFKHKDYSTTIDVFYFLDNNDKSYCFSFQPLVPMSKKRNLNKEQPSLARMWTWDSIKTKPDVFNGIKVYVPENTEQHLKSCYGETFMTPIPYFPVKGRPNMTEFTYEEMPACAFLKIGYV